MASGSSSVNDMKNKSKVTDTTQNDGMRNIVEYVNVSTTVRELLECPVCLDAMYPPIHQCSNGHTVCSRCKPMLHNRCPTCRHELGNIRCLALEKVGASIKLPCKYHSFGCAGMFPYYNKQNHETQCAFEPFNCPYTRSECPVVGNVHYLVEHLKVEHNVEMHNVDDFRFQYLEADPHDVEKATWMLKVINCDGQYFCLYYESFQHEKDPFPVYLACLRFMGNDNNAKKYTFTLAIGGNRRKMTRRKMTSGMRTPLSIRHEHGNFHNNCGGVMVNEDKATFFSHGVEQNLFVSGSIWEASVSNFSLIPKDQHV